MSFSFTLDHAGAISRYTEIAHRLPAVPTQPGSTRWVDNLGDLIDEFDVFVLDGFGVLNVGAEVIPGAVEQVIALKNAGKSIKVLTNGATMPVEKTVAKYQTWGLPLKLDDVVSSRDALTRALGEFGTDTNWGVAASGVSEINQLAAQTQLLEDDPEVYRQVEGFIFLSTSEWTDSRQVLLQLALTENPRPVLVGNPDLVAPHPGGMSLEPGYFAHQLADTGVCEPVFFGKPFSNAFEIVAQKIFGVSSHRVAMVGDTLHTDILGGSGFGWRTVLIKNHGLMKVADDERIFLSTGIRPDFVAATT